MNLHENNKTVVVHFDGWMVQISKTPVGCLALSVQGSTNQDVNIDIQERQNGCLSVHCLSTTIHQLPEEAK